MKLKLRSILALLLAAVMVPGLAACGSEKAPEPTATPEPAYVYQASFVDLASNSDVSYNPVAFNGEGIYATAYMKLGENIPEGVTPEYEGQYDVYGTRLFFLDYEGNVKQLDAYEPIPAPENTENLPNYTASSDLAGVMVNPDGTLTAIEQAYTSWFDGDESQMASEEAWQNWHNTTQYYIRRLNADGSEISSAPVDYDATNSYLSVYNGCLDDQGNVLVTSDMKLVAVAADGSIAYSMESEDYLDGVIRLRDGRVTCAVWGEQGMSLRVLDTEKNEIGEELQLPANAYSLITGSGEYDLYYSNGSNLYGYKLDTKEAVKVLNWIGCDVNGNTMGRVFVEEDGTVRGLSNDWTNGANQSTLVTLRLVPEDSVPKKETLTLATLYMEYQMTNQIVQFNRHSETCRIEVLDYSEYNTEENVDAGLTKMTTEILAGDMPDLLSLRQMPYRQLAAKGLLEDLYPYLDADKDLKREDFFPTVLSAMEVNGKLCEVMPSFSVMTLIGATSVVGDKPGWSFEDFDAALASMPEGCDPLDFYTTRDDMLQTLLYLDMDDFVDWTSGKCSFDSSEFIDMLQFANRFPAKFDWDTYEWGQGDDVLSRISSGQQMLMASSITSIDDVLYNDLYFGGSSTYVGYPSNNGVGNMLYLGDGYGMSSSCKNKDAAWEFLRSILTKDYQKSVWGLPVNKEAFNEQLKVSMTPEYKKDAEGNYLLDDDGERIQVSKGGIGFADGTTYDLYAMTQDQADRLLDLINTTTRSYEINDGIFQIVKELAQSYFAGQKSAEEVARLVQSKANIYVNEQR